MVLEDIEDFILLKGFTNNGQPLQIEAIQGRVNADLREKRARQAMELDTSGKQPEDEENKIDPFEDGKVEDQKRQFITPLRPHKKIWNFVEEDEETKVPHVLRAAADPNASYIDGRVQALLTIIEGMGTHLRMHDDQAWNHLNNMTLAIFQKKEDAIRSKMEAYEKMQEELANK